MTAKTNILPLICEAFGHNKKIRRDIDRLYKIKKYEFYRLARGSEIYSHIIIREGDIYREEYAKKALGILLYLHENPQDTGIMKKLNALIRKGWTRVYMWVENHEVISVGKYLYSGTQSGNYKTDDDFNTDMLMLIWFALLQEKEIRQDEIFTRIRQVLHQRLKHSSESSKTRYSRKTMEKDLLQNARKLKQRIYGAYGPVNSYNTIFHGHDDVYAVSESIALIADTENISISSVFNNVKFSNDDVDETLGIYCMYNQNKNTGESVKHLVHGLILKGMCKAYKQVKQHYFENNKETVFIDLENQEKEIQKLAEDNNILNKKLSNAEKRIQEIKGETEERYQKKIWELSNRIRCLEEELKKEKESNQELTALREFLFSLDKGLVPKEIEDVPDLDATAGVIVGGHQRWQRKMKELLPKWIFISSENFDTRVLDGADIVCFFTQHLSHALYYKAIEEIRKRNIGKIGYINSVNEELASYEIAKILKKQNS